MTGVGLRVEVGMTISAVGVGWATGIPVEGDSLHAEKHSPTSAIMTNLKINIVGVMRK
jgi:hypothetical protein